MEGLIPLVFKALKKNRVRSQYECLSSGAAQSYNIADFYLDGQSHVYPASSAEKVGSTHPERSGHRRYKSVGDFSMRFPTVDHSKNGVGVVSDPPVRKQLMRFRSHRMFSCVTGA